jgi:hypothetical protein
LDDGKGIVAIKDAKHELGNAGIGQHSYDQAIKELGLTVQYDTIDNKRVYFWVSPTVPETPPE